MEINKSNVGHPQLPMCRTAGSEFLTDYKGRPITKVVRDKLVAGEEALRRTNPERYAAVTLTLTLTLHDVPAQEARGGAGGSPQQPAEIGCPA